MNDIMGLLTMCRRAGRLCLGMDMTKDACNSKEARVVLVASDISEKTLKEVKYVCMKNDVILLALDEDMDGVGYRLGKRAGVMAVCDKGFAKKAAELLREIANDTEIM